LDKIQPTEHLKLNQKVKQTSWLQCPYITDKLLIAFVVNTLF